MKTLYITGGSNIVVDSDNNYCNRYERTRSAIDDVYLVKEPMHVVYGFGEKHKEVDVEPNDIIVTFYTDEFDTKMIVVKNEDWTNNLLAFEKKQQEEKERWAAEKADEGCNCESCGKCCA